MYEKFNLINGSHPWRDVSDQGFIDYPVRYRKGGKVIYFNFPLAQEMGLIPQKHPAVLNPRLEEKILKTFSLQILNEYDWANSPSFEKDGYEDRLYMATRYLQAQHKNKRGDTSGDGRSIWNGTIKTLKMTFDLSSCGTGVTILSPGAQVATEPIQTGDQKYGYSSGLAELDEMLGAAMMSEIFYRRGLPTERCLTVIAFEDNTAIGVRSAPNLIRPAHLFRYLKSKQWKELKDSFEYFLKRQEKNKTYQLPAKGKARYEQALQYLCRTYAKLAAVMEEEYIFNWLSWDGDNLLASGAILDYGSIRQFSAKHNKYRYKDVDRYSTSLTEQKYWARRILQTFIQAVDFICSKKKKRLEAFNQHPLLKEFDRYFYEEKQRRLLGKVGFQEKEINFLIRQHQNDVLRFQQCLYFFEDLKVQKGEEVLPDGINHSPVFLIRNILKELPQFLCKHFENEKRKDDQWPFVEPKDFCKIMAASYVDKRDLMLNETRRQKSVEFQKIYHQLIKAAGKSPNRMMKEILERSAVINYEYRQTGDGLVWVVEEVSKMRNRLTQSMLQQVMERFIESQVLVPGKHRPVSERELSKNNLTSKLLKRMHNNIELYSDSI